MTLHETRSAVVSAGESSNTEPYFWKRSRGCLSPFVAWRSFLTTLLLSGGDAATGDARPGQRALWVLVLQRSEAQPSQSIDARIKQTN